MRNKLALGLCFLFIAGITGCSGKSKSPTKPDNGLTVSFEEFQKILEPRSTLLLKGQNAFLTVMSMPGDKHPSIYRYDMNTKKFSKDYDHGQSIRSIAKDRLDQQIYVFIDNKGDENFGIYTYDTQKKSISPLFVKNGFKSFMINTDKDAKTMFIGSNFENKAIYSVYKMDLATKKVERISDGKTNLFGTLVSPSGDKVVAMRNLSNNENQIFLIDVKKKKSTLLFKQKDSTFDPSYFSPDETSLIGNTDYKKDRVGCSEIKFKQPNKINYIMTEKNKDLSCMYGEWSKLFFVNERFKGRSTIKMFKKPFTDEIKLPEILHNQSVDIVDFDKDTQSFLIDFSAANNPGSLYTFNINDQKYAKVLDYNVSGLKEEQLATTYDFEYKSFDGLPIHGIIHAKPEWLTSGKKYPVILWPHGGPDHLESHDYRSIFQFLSLNGYIVFAPNFRGSAGYGKKFETLNDKDWGGGHIKDLVAGKNELVKLPYVDANNIFILGGSFGGYSTLATVVFQTKEFKAAVGVVAIGNLFTFMKSIPPDEGWQTEFKREIGDPVKDKKLYEERSPFFHVKNIEIPLQIYQAENDVRTVKAEMDTFVEEMKKNNKPVSYFVLKDVGHGLETPQSRKQIYEGSVLFFNSYLTR